MERKFNIEKLDKILLTQKEVDLLFEWRDNHKEFVRDYKPVLLSGRIMVDDYLDMAFVDKFSFVYFDIYYNNKIIHSFALNTKTKKGITTFTQLNMGEKEFEYNSSLVSLHASLMAYMEYYSDKKEYVEVKDVVNNKAVKKRGKKSSKKSKTNIVRIKKKVYKINVTKESIQLDRKRYERKVEKWSVRGHWRTLKSGNKVWIKPYVKGQGKEITPKDYRL